jgi:NitT/TauT family transport system permease protein
MPASLPSIVTGMKLGWTLAWHGGVSAELIQSTIGLGLLLQMGLEPSDAAEVIGIMMLTVIFGVLLDQFVFGLIQKRMLVRWGLAQKT